MADNAEYKFEFDYSDLLRVMDEAERRHFEWLYYKALIQQLHPELVYNWNAKKN